MADNDLTTVQVDVETRDKLRVLAEANYRTMTRHLQFLVDQDYRKLVMKRQPAAQPAEKDG